MASEKGFSMESLMQAGFWEQNRNRIIGLLVVSGIAVVAIMMFQQAGESKEAASWQAIMDGGNLAQDVQITDEVRGSAAEPWAMLIQARQLWTEEKYAEARAVLGDIQQRFPNNSIQDSVLPEFLQMADAELKWYKDHPKVEKNPEVPDPQCLTIKTAAGDVKIGLYPEQAPQATLELLRLCRNGSFVKSAFDEASEDTYVLWSPVVEKDESDGDDSDDDDSDDDADEDEAKASPLARGIVSDRNYLSHFEGSVSFRRPTGEVDADAQPRVAIYLSEAPYQDNQEVVFGQVMAGLDILKQISERDLEEGKATLAEPVAIDAIEEGADLKKIE